MSLDSIREKKLEWAKKYPSLCVFPYNSIQIRQSSQQRGATDITCCCNLTQQSIDINSLTNGVNNQLREIKHSMQAGVLPLACIKCKTEEAAGGQSERIRGLLEKSEEELVEFVNTQKIKRYDLMIVFSNLCNLSCRSCGSSNSTTYAKITNDTSLDYLSQDITEIDSYWQLITSTIVEKLPQQEHFDLHLMGGEPLIQPGLEKLFDWLIEHDLAKDITLKLTTALSANFTDKLLNYFKQFKFVRFNLSIDSVGDNYQYVRWPVKFEKIERNLEHIVTCLKPYTFGCSLDPVFSLNNIFYIDNYLDYWSVWFDRTGHHFEIINTNLVLQTNLIDVQALPVKYRIHLIELLTKCLSHDIFVKHSSTTLHLYSFIVSTIEELKSWPDDSTLWNRFLKHTAEFDCRTNTQFSVLNDRLYNLLDNNDRVLFSEKLKAVDTKTRYSIFSL